MALIFGIFPHFVSVFSFVSKNQMGRCLP